MKKITLLLIFLLPFLGFSQSANEKIQAYLNANHVKMGLTSQDVNGWIVESTANSESTGIDNYYIRQRVNGIPVFAAVTNIWVKNGEVINAADRFVSNASVKANAATAQLSVTEALSKAITLLHIENPGVFEIIQAESAQKFTISNGILTEDPITAALVYQPIDDNTLRLAWDFTIDTPGHQHMWSVRIDALDGKIIDQHDLVISCSFGERHEASAAEKNLINFNNSFYKSESLMNIQSGSYRVIPYYTESPNHGPRVLLVSPDDPAASPFGWHDTNGVTGADFTFTRGNNVYALEDADGNNTTNGASPNGGASLTFDFPYLGTSDQPANYRDAATTNLFYMNNIMHDVWYHYGFNESNGNFQQKNYTGFVQPGISGDNVIADAQDQGEVAASASNRNNANFSTLADGQRSRMQMYLWTVGPSSFFVTSPASLAGGYQSVQNGFSPGHVDLPIAPAFIQSDLVLYLDSAASTSEACVLPSNAAAMNGKIVILRRANCEFIMKVKNAQNAGAVAVIVVDNVANELVTMSGADATITIPAVFITQGLGEALIAQMQTQPVNVKLQAPDGAFVNSDGDFDNGIIAHEYGHGITNRLTGGPANVSCLQNAEQAGEGWSDWFSLMTLLKAGDLESNPRTVATFAVSEAPNGGGIRNFPYSTDMSINPLTFADSNDDESHNRGEFMAAVLWDLSWAYINKYGLDGNIYSGTGGNNKVMRLVIDALKLQPCSPTFVEFRNALIAADQATTGGQDYCMIWHVFARRGMGVNASSGARTSALDQVEDFTEPAPGPNCSLAVNYFEANDMIRVYPNPSNGQITIHINQFSGKVNMQVVDINGRVVYNVKNDNFNIEKTIDLTHLQTGMYVLKINGEALNYTQKIIIK